MATITGTSAAETLGNNAGVSDTITGLAGHDTFVYTRSGAAETDVMTDFGATYFGGPIDGTQAGFPTVTASGTLSAWLARGNAAFNFSLSVTGLDFTHSTTTTADDVSAAHFHSGAPGVSGGVIFGFYGAPNNDTDGDTQSSFGATTTFTGQWDAAEGNGTTLTAQLANIMAGNIYVNFHTGAHPSGEIRGQAVKLDGGLDKLDVTGANIGEFSTMQFLLSNVSGSAQFSTKFDGNAHTMQFQGVLEANLSAADFLFAGAVNETITGTGNADDLFGAGGKDALMGGKGGDRLFGESGKDTLNGGAGQDLLFGGTSGDTFAFKKTSDTKVGAAQRDVIGDFSQAEGDKINLHKMDADTTTLGNQDFFLGGAVFTSTPGELIQVSGGGVTVLSGDVNGNGVADFEIEIAGAPVLVNGDFTF